jgi:hypothetical protein
MTARKAVFSFSAICALLVIAITAQAAAGKDWYTCAEKEG